MPILGLQYSDEQLWDVLNGVLPAWLLLAVAPRWRLTVPIATLTAAFYSLLYVGAMAGSISGAAGSCRQAGRNSPRRVSTWAAWFCPQLPLPAAARCSQVERGVSPPPSPRP